MPRVVENERPILPQRWPVGGRDCQTGSKAVLSRASKWAEQHANRLLCVALCQGAALHYVTGTVGIQNFNVWTFYRKHPARAWYPRRNKPYDFGSAKFGQSLDRPDFIGCRVDCLGRSMEAEEGDDPIAVVQRYLQEGRTDSARLLAQKATIFLEPDCGKIISPQEYDRDTATGAVFA